MTARHNRLAYETSPYLLQHADNPVDWYPWGDEALAKAQAEQKPIFLSIGYSACHWCHVMERESFANESIAALLNKHFVSIKVDREERPDLDDFYMTFVQMTTGGGGWPMSVFLTPEGKPFFGGTYFPPDDAYGRRGFSHILRAVAQTWEQQREEVLSASSTLLSDLRSHLTRSDPPGQLEPSILDRAVQEMLDRFDPVEGGFGGAPKFPPSYVLSFLMKQHWSNDDPRVRQAITLTLDKMAAGGMYDQLGGGFHRYSVDANWLVPHFEKMLYDNAQLATTYIEALQLMNKPLYRRVAIEVLDYVLRDLRDPAGGFHSSEDADSEGHEGNFYVWTPEEIIDVLGPEDGKLFCDFYGVTNAGNFEGHRSILHVRTYPELFANSYRLSPSQLEEKLSRLRSQLLKARSSRVRPFRDDKVLTEWNGLMLTALAKGYQVLGDVRYLDAATECVRFIESTMLTPSGLLRVYRQGTAKQPGFLADYAFFINGLVDLYEAAFDPHWLELGAKLTEEMIDRFGDTQSGGFFTTATGQTNLPIRQKDSFDGAVPSGNSVAAIALLRLSTLLDRSDWHDVADRTIASLSKSVLDMPTGFMNLLNAIYISHHSPVEFAIVGSTDDPSTKSMIGTIHGTFHPYRVIALHDPGRAHSSQALELIPMLRNRRQIDNKATAYICHNRACLPPATTLPELSSRLVDACPSYQQTRMG